MTASATSNSQGQLKPNNRLGNKKTKTGCLTCKARKVKCDETKPVCKRCINADRTCRGYIDVFVAITHAEPSQNSSHEVWSLSPPSSRSSSGSPPRSPFPPLSTGDLRALQYYQVEVSRLLGGSVEPSFWTKSVLQLSEHEPAVKQALMAISTEWESKLYTNVWDRDEARRVSMIAYNKALKQTTERLNQPDADTVALATCVLFLCLHCLQGDKLQAAKFLQTGSGVMLKVLQGPNAVSENPESLKSMFLPIFERLVVLLRLFGVTLPSFRTTEKVLYNTDGTFRELHTLDEARNVLYWLVAESHELILKTKPHRFGRTAEPLDLKTYTQKQEEQLTAYRSWSEEFENLCKLQAGFASEHRHYISLLRLVHAVTFFWLSTCLDQYEALCDNYNHFFKLIIENAEVVIGHNGPLPFTFEMGVIPPLYLVVLKCREPSLRQQALNLLGRAPEREGLWRREEAYRVARRIYDLESKDFEILADGTVFQDARICEVQTGSSDETGTHVTIAAKLYGSSQVWKIWDELVPYEEHLSSDWSGGF